MDNFFANFVYSGEDGGVLMAGLADDQYETKRYLLFQKSRNPTEQDIELGQDNVHVTLNESSASAYGGVESLSLFSEELQVVMDQKTASRLGTSRIFSIAFNPHLEGLDELSIALEEMFESFIDCRGRGVK